MSKPVVGDKVAFYWEGEPGDTKSITYAELLAEVSKTANALKELGVQKGDRVAVYMPMILETPIALLACARIGAPHTMVFGGFSAESLRDRINDATCKVVITADGGYRRGAAAALKPNVDIALEDAPSVEKVLVAKRTGSDVAMSGWPRRVVGRNRQPPERRLPARADGQRGHAVPALHVWHHGSAKRHRPHYCRVSAWGARGRTRRYSTSRMTMSTGVPPILAGSPGIATSCTDRSPTAPPA